MSTVEYPLAEPTKESLLLVTFQYGNGPTFVRYTDWDSDVLHPVTFEPHTSMTPMKVDPPKYTGLFREKPCVIALPANDFTNALSSGEPWPQVKVLVEELTQDPDETVGRILTFYTGEVRRTVRNYQGNPEIVQVELENVKNELGVPLGLVATHHCVWIFGDTKGCDPNEAIVNLPALKETGTMTVIDGATVTITGLTTPRDRYWHAGFVEIDTLRIKIRDWSITTPTTFELVKRPPSAWLNASVTVAPGCDKTVETCRLWLNEEHFCGAGYAMPAYHPVLETP